MCLSAAAVTLSQTSGKASVGKVGSVLNKNRNYPDSPEQNVGHCARKKVLGSIPSPDEAFLVYLQRLLFIDELCPRQTQRRRTLNRLHLNLCHH